MLSLWILLSLSSLTAYSSPLSVKEIQSQGYFNKLNYRDPETLALMPSFENQLMESADEALTYATNDPYILENALIFAYTALYLDNLLEAKRFGSLAIPELPNGKIISASGDQEEEYEKRKQLAIKYIEKAKELLPNDYRVDLWYYGIKSTHVSPEYVNDLLAIAQERGNTFSLMSSIIVTKEMDLSFEQEQVITKLVKKFTGITSPCFFGKTKSQCRSTPIAPFSAQNGILMMADHRLKISKVNTSNRQKKIGRIYSNILYRSTGLGWMKSSTPLWENRNLISERITLTKKYVTHEKIQEYLNSDKGRVIYGCASCHSQPRVAHP
jgi:hypothetical protein